ncbi:hypothetical protein [Lysobacter arvi]|uniref:Uncharacterized protein n=1 Tax=Lysobacter arvi TaxID=3038776 RepID=A0ABU1CFA6_9GAMM|nr:hypothetical protein [Lysobacter arvi]MDR0183608.1 hypothetical protein [Lysobacter arvi]
MGKIGAMRCGLAVVLLVQAMLLRAMEPAVAVVGESPGCEHDKLGAVVVEVGERVSEITQDDNVPGVDYARALRKLGEAAARKGANVVVLRHHQGVYFTRNGKRSRKPVYVKLSGAAIRMPSASLEQCPLEPFDVAELEARSREIAPQNVNSRTAFDRDDPSR